ncbi:MAG TPA: T9SS type A sorting domain-containing protein [Bacteroidia bacterium]|nr:T9SS type A sorting domain-containing protein [Bacteroidia bacterium]
MQACCRIDKGATPYQINFYTLPNPSNCFTLTQTTPNTLPVISDVRQQWLPLSYTGDQISVHCPGCLAPGAIVSNYKINRVSFGLQDSNNDGRTDNATKIIKGDNYYNTFKNYLNENFAHYSDTLEDYLSAYFQDGDNSGTGGGYTYQQLVTAGVPLHFMQLSRIIPFGLDSFNLTIDSVVLYIDTLIPNTNACIDCADFNLTGNGVVTQSVVAFNRVDAYSHCVMADVPRNQLLFTFCDTTGGNIQSFETFTNTSFPFVAFKTGQRYRLKVRYSVCGNYRLPFNSVSNLVCNSPISNNLWFTGKEQGADAIATLPQMPNTVGAMETDFHYSFNASSGYPLPNQNFVDSARFYCETFGGRFYFAPTSYYNNSTVTNSQGCEKRITAVYIADLAGYRNRIFDVYPYEYRVPPLFADTINIQVPNGYYISMMRARSSVYYTNNGQPMAPFSAYDTLTAPQLTGLVQIPIDSLPVMHCLQQSMSPAGNDTAAFAGDQFTRLELQCFIRRFDCSTAIDTLPLSSVYTGTGLFQSECNPTENLSCTPLAIAADSIPFNANIQPLLVHPNLNLVLPVSHVANAQQQQLCWTVKVLNPKVVVQPGTPDIYSTGADNVFLGVPLNGAIPALQNWQFTPTGQSTINAVNGIIPLTTHLSPNDSVTGQLCATFVSCDSTIKTFPLYYGWNCNDFPTATSQIPDTVCGADYVTLGIEYFEASLTGEGKGYYPNNYTLCDTLKKFTCIVNSNPGYAYPDFAGLINIPPGLNILSAYILNPNATPVAVSYLTGSAPSWQITPANMQALGFANGGIHLTDKLCIYFNLIPECAFAADTLLPDILVAGKNYCGDSLSYTAYFSYNNQSPLFMDSTACTDCWSITKTADTDTAAAVTDTVTYTITVCNNSANTQTGTLADNTPANFVITNSTLPATVTLNSMQCDTFTVSGYFTSPGSCFYNVASVTSPMGTTWKDSVCVTVINVCNVPNAQQIADSSFSLPISASYSNASFVLHGRFYVNDTLTLINCSVYAYPGAQIIVLTGGTLILQGTSITACTQMWKGIVLNDKSRLVMTEQSLVADADIGIQAMNGSSFFLLGSSVTDCVRSIFVPQQSNGMNNIQGYVNDCRFGLYAAAFKPDYTGQPPHHTMPRAGMEFNDVVITIGDYEYNEFRNCNWGIYAVRSMLKVQKGRFYNMNKGGSIYGSAAHKGSAIVAESKTAAKAGKIQVADCQIDTCEHGIYTEWTTADINNVNALHVTGNGSYHLYCNSANMSTYVGACNIVAGKAGIVFQNSEQATMTAKNNTLKVTTGGSSVGIKVIATNNNTGNYMLKGNVIEAANGNGITVNFAKNATIVDNMIKLSGNTTNGIALTGCDSSTVSCNTVSGRYPAMGYQNKGVNISHSTNNFMSCNFTDSTYFGNYFEGACNGTRFRGTSINRHFEGLRLYTNAVIDTQAHAGNLWFGPFTTGGYGANNLNNGSQIALDQSALLIDYSYGGAYLPTIPVNNTGWIINDVGTEFNCSGYILCEDISHDERAASQLQLTIAEDSLKTSEFTDETKIMAKNYLYKDLKENDSLANGNFLLTSFLVANENTATGHLYDVNNAIKEADIIGGAESQTLSILSSLTDSVIGNIYYIDSLANADSTLNLINQRDSLVQQLIIALQNKTDLLNQLGQAKEQSLINTQSVSNSIITSNTPDEYEKEMCDVEIAYQTGGKAELQSRYSQVLNIAIQCPHVGGKAVYKARSFMALLNDSIEYDDVSVCTQAGYRKAATNEPANEVIKGNISIIPNPANEVITVTLSDDISGICKILFYDVVGKLILSKELDCNKKTHSLSVKNLSEGVYTVKAKIANQNSKQFKLIVVR